MNWIDRYVAQVKWYMPRRDREDVADELNSLLEEKASDQEAELGRALNEGETFALLREVGHPLTVASSYTSAGPLVSETLLPLYWLVVRFMVIIILSLYAASVIWFYVMGDRFPWPGFGLSDLFNVGMFYFAAITLVFHFAGRYLEQKDILRSWNPARLPSVEAKREPLYSTIIVVVIFLGWFRLLSLIPVDHTLEVLSGATGNWLATFILWLKIQVLLCLPVYLWLLFRPYWSPVRRLMIMLADLAIIAGGLIALAVASSTPEVLIGETATEWEAAIGPLSSLILGLWTLFVSLDFFHQGYRIWREKLDGKARV